jgi:Fe-S-cluster containining protein
MSLDRAIEARASAIAAAGTEWPCRKGCDACCRSLAGVPVLTEPEWLRLRAAVAELPREARKEVERGIRSLTPDRPVVCPILDRESGACRVYAARPVACRTYGFYVDREGGLFCPKVQDEAAGREDIVWGNQEAVEARLDAIGPRRNLREWLLADTGDNSGL